MTARPLQVLIMAKAPVAGRVKTRLSPPLSPQQGADVAEAALADTLDAVLACQADFKVLALDGTPGPWLPRGIDVIPQRGGGLDERLANAWADTRARTAGWGLQIGMDTPQVRAGELDAMLDQLRWDRPGALLGPAVDGGWWVIGLPGTDPNLVFPGLPMSAPHTCAAQQLRLEGLGLEVILVPERRDIDTIDDLRAVAHQDPWTRTAALTRRLLGSSHPVVGRESKVA
jgi:glycosyltransferase A (GT-A) superfamily protein (DUF2064 family)